MAMDEAGREWTAVAAAWDDHVDFVDDHSADATAALVERLAPAPGERVLELAAGPGSLGPMWARLVGPSGSVVLSDVAPGMVAVAERRNAGEPNVTVDLVDASAIDRPDASFDVVACRMGLMFTPEPSAALAEIHRVLRPGGRVGAMTWGGMEHNPWMTCVGMAAMVHGLVSGGPPVGPGGIFSLSDPGQVRTLLEDAGFREVQVEEVDVSFRSPDVDSHVRRVSSLAGPLAAAFAGASEEQLTAVHRTAAELAAPYTTDDGVELPGRIVLATATR